MFVLTREREKTETRRIRVEEKTNNQEIHTRAAVGREIVVVELIVVVVVVIGGFAVGLYKLGFLRIRFAR